MHYLVNISENYNYAEKVADDRTKGWPMVDSMWKVLAAIVAYNWIIRYGVNLMKNRKPYNLRWIILIYNITVLLLNAYICVETLFCIISLKYNVFCNEDTKNSRDPLEMRFARITWLFYMAKYFELLDTVFIVLRKKEQNLSFLHVYHHSTIVLFAWIHTKWFPTGNSYFVNAINAAVHVVMYSYYGLSCLGPKVAKYLSWKRYLTQLQLIQFFSGALFCIIGITMNCTFYPRWYNALEVSYVVTFLFLFSKFYFNAYTGNKTKMLLRKIMCGKKEIKNL